MQKINSTSIKCICAIDPNCQTPAYVDDSYYSNENGLMIDFSYYMPGLIQSCFPIDSLLLSTLQCLYADSYCFVILMYIIFPKYFVPGFSDPLHPIRPLVYDPSMSRFPPNSSISTIIQELMIEQWNFSSSYQNFYETCAPTYCSYSIKVRKESFIQVVIILISMIGGVVVSLRLLTPYLVKFTLQFSLTSKSKKEPPKQREPGNYSRVHSICLP